MSEPSCTPKTESSCTSCAPEFPVSNGRRRWSECVSQWLLCDSPLSVGVQVCRRPRSSSCTRSPGSAVSSLCSISVASASVSWSESTTSRSCRCQRESWRALSTQSSLLTLRSTASVLDFQRLPQRVSILKLGKDQDAHRAAEAAGTLPQHCCCLTASGANSLLNYRCLLHQASDLLPEEVLLLRPRGGDPPVAEGAQQPAGGPAGGAASNVAAEPPRSVSAKPFADHR